MITKFSFLARVAMWGISLVSLNALASQNLNMGLKRASYLLNGTVPTDDDFSKYAKSEQDYRVAVRNFISHDNFYDIVLRYHERALGVGLPLQYLEDLKRSDLDGKENKFARLTCNREDGVNGKFRCFWSTARTQSRRNGKCEMGSEQTTSAFWRPGLVIWACPSVVRTCGADLSKCFIEYADENTAKNSELGTSDVFDSRFAVMKSLSRQPAGLATAVVVNNYPYTKILEPGLTAVDGAIAHFFKQQHHFDLTRVHMPQALRDKIEKLNVTHTRFQLVYGGSSYESGGILSTFGWLRRFEKNRTRANQTYERLLCRKFTAELPKVFPQDPGNLRTTAPCSGCHATLDPLADFYSVWGEGGDLYLGSQSAKEGTFAGKSGVGLASLAEIIRGDEAFATCTVQNVWEWLMGRKFYKAEEALRTSLTGYFVKTNYSFKELVYAVATHPSFLEGTRADATVTEPLEQPALGKIPEPSTAPCATGLTFDTHIKPYISSCTVCHLAGTSRQSLETEAQWKIWGKQAVGMMASGNMPPGQSGPPSTGRVYDLKEAVRCWLEENP